MKKYIAIVLILIFSICLAGTFKWQIKIENSDGSTFNSSDSAGASVRLYHSDATGATGTLSQTMTEISNGIWYADVDTDSAGWYEVKTYTDADPTWTSVSGFDPVWIGTKEYLPLDGSKSMTDSLGLGGNALNSVYGISLNDTTSLIRGGTSNIAFHNLLDKSAEEEIAGAWEFSSTVDVGTDNLLVDNNIISSYTYITYSESGEMTKAECNRTIFIADNGYTVDSVSVFYETAESTAGTMYLQVERLSGTEAVGAGDDVFTNNTNNGIDLKSGAKNIQAPSLDATNKELSTGDRLGVLLSEDGTELDRLSVTIRLIRR